MNTEEQNNTHRSYFFKKLFENPNVSVLYGVRGVSQIKFTMSDSFLVFYDFDILSMIKRKNPFRFYCVILILNLSRLISPITILILKVCRV